MRKPIARVTDDVVCYFHIDSCTDYYCIRHFLNFFATFYMFLFFFPLHGYYLFTFYANFFLFFCVFLNFFSEFSRFFFLFWFSEGLGEHLFVAFLVFILKSKSTPKSPH